MKPEGFEGRERFLVIVTAGAGLLARTYVLGSRRAGDTPGDSKNKDL